MLSLFLGLALYAQDFRSESLQWCKKFEDTFKARVACSQYMIKCAREIEANNVIYQRKDTLTICKYNWELYHHE